MNYILKSCGNTKARLITAPSGNALRLWPTVAQRCKKPEKQSNTGPSTSQGVPFPRTVREPAFLNTAIKTCMSGRGYLRRITFSSTDFMAQ